MARKPKTPPRELPVIPQELVDPFVKVPMAAEAVQDAAMAFKKALIERALGAEMGHHLGYATGTERPPETTNQRNGRSAKTVLTDDGPLALQIPRDRDASFEPILIPKHERRFTGFDDKIIAMYTRGMTVRDIQAFLLEQYGAEVSQEFVSSVTDAVMDEVLAWQSRPLEPMYPVVFFDALRVKIRSDGLVRNKAVYLALAILPDGTRDILGLWIENTEGAKFWMKVFNDLKTRGVQDMLIAVTDGLQGMEQALGAVFPQTTLQTCIVHLIRSSLDSRQLERSQGARCRAQAGVHGGECRDGASRAGRLRPWPMGPPLPDGGRILATGLGTRDSLLYVPAGSTQSDLHHQRHRECERQSAQDHQDARSLPK